MAGLRDHGIYAGLCGTDLLLLVYAGDLMEICNSARLGLIVTLQDYIHLAYKLTLQVKLTKMTTL